MISSISSRLISFTGNHEKISNTVVILLPFIISHGRHQGVLYNTRGIMKSGIGRIQAAGQSGCTGIICSAPTSMQHRGFTCRIERNSQDTGITACKRRNTTMETILYVGMDIHTTNYTLCSFTFEGDKPFGLIWIGSRLSGRCKVREQIET